MTLQILNDSFSICKIEDLSQINHIDKFYFISKTDQELSLVCKTEDVPKNIVERDDNWKAFRIAGQLDFSLVGILSKIATILSDYGISVFAVSTFDTDYFFIKEKDFFVAQKYLIKAGYRFI